MQELFELAWNQRRYESQRRFAQALVFHPNLREDVAEILKEQTEPVTEEWQLEMLKTFGYQIRPEHRKPDRIWISENEWVPIWLSPHRDLSSVKFTVNRSYRAVKAQLNQVDFQTVNKIKKDIEEAKKEGKDHKDLLARLKEAETKTFRDRFQDHIHKNIVPPTKEQLDGMKKAEWVIISNVLRSPKSLVASFSSTEGGNRKSAWERVRQGINIYFCFEENARSDAYIEYFANYSTSKGWFYKDWFLSDLEPKKQDLNHFRIESSDKKQESPPTKKKRGKGFSKEEIKKQKELIKKLKKLADPEKNFNQHEVEAAKTMAERIAKKYNIDLDSI